MRVKKLLLILGVFTCSVLSAQQRPYYTQYIMNNYIINPAVAGIENYWDVKASHRMQWVGLQDAPVTTYLTIHGPLHKSDYERETATSSMPAVPTRAVRLIGRIMLLQNRTRELVLRC
jgi:hypothetical protein